MTTAPQQQQQPHHQRPQHSPYQLQHQYHHEVPPPTPPSQHLQYGLHVQLDTATYDPDEVVPRGSPLMQPLRPRLEPSPSPPPEIPPGQVSFSPPPIDGRTKSNRLKIQPLSGDAVLVSYLDDGRRPEIAQTAGSQALPSADDDNDDFCNDNSDDNGNGNGNGKHDEPRSGSGPSGKASCRDTHGRTERNDTLTQTRNPMTATSTLQAVAVDALQAVAAEPSRHHVLLKSDSDISVSTRRLSIRDEQSLSLGHHPRELSLPRGHLKAAGARSPPVALPTPGELPPLQMDSPKSESNGGQSLSLPSIRSTLGDINRLPAEPRTHLDRDLSTRPGGPTQAFPRSPSTGIPRLPAVSAGNHVSPPISPNEAYPRGLPSPHSISTPSPFYYSANGLHQRQSLEYISNASGDTSRTDHTPSALATTVSVADRMSIDGLTNPQAGLYICNVSGCSAPPFQTQYLLNSHANVHSSARPHYCHVRGCPRSEGGKGFKRKNEMIRHGLVHDSPGYVCPFCADREHKYPRPDNLQRHVRVHHVDKDKDDPLLRDVLAQRPDGPNRGRRRRGAPP